MSTSSSDGCIAINWSDSVHIADTSSSGRGFRIGGFISRVTRVTDIKAEVYVIDTTAEDVVYVTLIAAMHEKFEAEGPYASFKTVDDLLEYLKRKR